MEIYTRPWPLKKLVEDLVRVEYDGGKQGYLTLEGEPLTFLKAKLEELLQVQNGE